MNAPRCVGGVVALGLTVLGGAAHAQALSFGALVTQRLPWIPQVGGSQTLGPALTAPVASLSSASVGGGVNRVSLNLKDEYTVLVESNGATYGGQQSTVSVNITVGSLPVRFTNLDIVAQFKQVNAGGAFPDPGMSSNVHAAAALYPPGSFSTSRFVDVTTSPQTGEGFWVQNIAPGTATTQGFPTILIPGQTYRFSLYFDGFVNFAARPESPLRAFTLEAGGGFSSFDGFTASFEYEVVPAPGAGAALAFGVLALAGRRRR